VEFFSDSADSACQHRYTWRRPMKCVDMYISWPVADWHFCNFWMLSKHARRLAVRVPLHSIAGCSLGRLPQVSFFCIFCWSMRLIRYIHILASCRLAFLQHLDATRASRAASSSGAASLNCWGLTRAVASGFISLHDAQLLHMLADKGTSHL